MTRIGLLAVLAVFTLSLGLALSASASHPQEDPWSALVTFDDYTPVPDPTASIAELLDNWRMILQGPPTNPWIFVDPMPLPPDDLPWPSLRSTGFQPVSPAPHRASATDDRPVCPRCSSDSVAPIVYGYPTAATMASAEAGEVELGGCIIGGDEPDWHCRSCDYSWKDQFVSTVDLPQDLGSWREMMER